MLFVRRVLSLTLNVCVGLTLWASQPTAIELKPTINLDRPVVFADTAQTVYLLVRFDIPVAIVHVSRERPRLSLGLVLDRSGSMSDKGKMTYAKQAAIATVGMMSPRDNLAVVEYDDQITVLWPSTPVEAPHLITRRISQLTPRGSTDLVGGLMKGVDEVYGSMVDGGINRALLLSDGLANRGITDPREIRRLVRQARRKGITISTMGLGLEYDEDLLQMIAEEGGGNYYYIESPSQMRQIFEQEMGTLFTTVARDVKATLTKSARVRNARVYGFLSEEKQSDLTVDLRNLYSGESISLVIRLELDALSAGVVDLGDLQISYTDVETNTEKIITSAISVTATHSASSVKEAMNEDATVEATLVVADDFHQEQVRLFEAGESDRALANISQFQQELEEKNASLNNVMIRKKLDALGMESELMRKAESAPALSSAYIKCNKARYYSAMQGKRVQYLLQEGDRGVEVQRLKQALKEQGFYAGVVDNEFTAELTKSIKKIQKYSGLTVDGVAGPRTLQKLGLY